MKNKTARLILLTSIGLLFVPFILQIPFQGDLLGFFTRHLSTTPHCRGTNWYGYSDCGVYDKVVSVIFIYLFLCFLVTLSTVIYMATVWIKTRRR